MSPIVQSSTSNRLLALMTPADFALLSDVMRPVEFEVGSVLIEPNTAIRDVYFVEAGIVSQVAISENERVEAGLYGRDGFCGTALLLDVDRTPYQHLVQVAGHGFRVEASDFVKALNGSASLKRLLLHFAYVLGVQVGYTALCNKSSVGHARLARWILMYQDRLDGESLFLTHTTLGLMLGTRRAGITDAIHILEGKHMIKATRGHLRIVDRDALVETADSYGPPEAEYARLIGPMRAPSKQLVNGASMMQLTA